MADQQPGRGSPLTYAQAGVDIDAGNALVKAIKPLARATARLGADADLGGFGALFDLKAAGFSDPILVAANDGVGTKIKIAIEADRHDTIGIDLVAMCVNDLLAQGAEPLFFLDYFASSKLDVETARKVVSGIAEGCRLAGAALIGGETAEMPGLYAEGDYDLAGFSVGAAERGQLLPRGDVQPGDVAIGIASSGVHSNGFSLVRRIVADSGLDWHAPAPFASGTTLAEALLEPTRIYAKSVLAAMKQTGAIKALAHITGGGLLENLPRVLPDSVIGEIDLSAWEPQPVFSWLAQSGGIESREMLRTFNCGIGMIAICASDTADVVCQSLNDQGERAVRIGHVATRDGEETIRFTGSLKLSQ